MPTLFCFGYGYTAQALARRVSGLPDWHVAGTSRQAGAITLADVPAFWQAQPPTHVLVSIPPQEGCDIVLETYQSLLVASSVVWLGYLSTTGVYGDTHGAWVDEETIPQPSQPRSLARYHIEKAWLAAHPTTHIFRLAGIYGAGRNALADILAGKATAVNKPGQVFSRLHVEDIVSALLASMMKPTPQAIYNLADDEPAAGHTVVNYAARLLRRPPLPLLDYESAPLSPMARQFYAECRRVSNLKIKRAFGLRWQYPTYREGLYNLYKSANFK